MEQESLLAQTRRLLNRFGLKARKGLAQHFLIDRGTLDLIIEAAELKPADTVIEVGPGLGVLTRALAAHAGRVIAVELDARLASVLGETLTGFDNVTVLNRDVLETVPASLLAEAGVACPDDEKTGRRYKVVANLPYYITSPVLRHFLEATVKPEIMVVMVQKEIAQAITAKPGAMSLLAVGVQFYGRPKTISYVPARHFYPAPRVDSAIMRIDVYSGPPVPVADEKAFFEVVKAGFAMPRKQIINPLGRGLGLDREEALSILEKAGISFQRRAESLSLDEWTHLQREYERVRNKRHADGTGAG